MPVKAFSLGLLLQLGLPDHDIDRDGQQPKVSKVALNDNIDIRLSAFPLNRMGKGNFNEFFNQSLMTSNVEIEYSLVTLKISKRNYIL